MKKIIFNDRFELTKAVLNGTKTTFRRIEKIRTLDDAIDDLYIAANEDHKPICTFTNMYGEGIGCIICKYKVDEVVAVAQPYKDIVNESAELNDILTDKNGQPLQKYKSGWDNKLFVDERLMPYHIRIKCIKSEKLQDISDEDCIREGVRKIGNRYSLVENGKTLYFSTPKEAFEYMSKRALFDASWARNYIVVVYEFELVNHLETSNNKIKNEAELKNI